MRNIDPELDTLFAQAEGPKLASTFLAGLRLNDPVRCEVIVKELIRLELNVDSDASQAAKIFEQYMRESLASYGVSADKYLLEIQRMKELVAEEGGFDTYIKPILLDIDDSSLANSRKRTIASAEDLSYPNKRQRE